MLELLAWVRFLIILYTLAFILWFYVVVMYVYHTLSLWWFDRSYVNYLKRRARLWRGISFR